MLASGNVAGLWVYYDPSLDGSSELSQDMLGSFLSRAAEGFQALNIASPVADAPRAILAISRSYASASIFTFDFRDAFAEEPRFKGLRPRALLSAFMEACSRLLINNGAAFCCEGERVACLLGSSTRADPDLALFQFRKSLKRLLPRFASSSFPEGRAFFLDPSSKSALEELRSFLAR